MKKTTSPKSLSHADTHCAQCGRPQKADEGMWLLCGQCGTFRCPSCFGSIFSETPCPVCREREEMAEIMEYLQYAMKEERTVKRPKKGVKKAA